MMIQKGVSPKNPNPNANPARQVETDTMNAYTTETKNQEVQ